MVQAICEKGFLHWSDDIGRSIQRDIQNTETKLNSGWVDEKMIQRISSALCGAIAAPAVDNPSGNEEKNERQGDRKKRRPQTNFANQMELPFGGKWKGGRP